MKQISIFFIGIALVLVGCNAGKKATEYRAELANNPDFIHQSYQALTDVIVYDIFSPPVASRIYAYSSLAAYEILVHQNAEYKSLTPQLNDFPEIPQPDSTLQYCLPLASIHAFFEVGKTMIFSKEMLKEKEDKIYQSFQKLELPQEIYNRSLAYGKQVAAAILERANHDNYKETRGMPRYSVNDNVGRWIPTPPDYMDGIEPHWNKIKAFTLDSAQQFAPKQPTEYDITEGSDFYKEIMEVYNTGNNLTEDQMEIAKFWDCNPYVTHHTGHAMFATKKITPGGHWINIAYVAGKVTEADIMRSSETYTVTSLALFDAFISCWDEKYRSSLIRPETIINNHFDESWNPLLQTPPFPEYTSGHSVISAAAATALTSLYGDSFSFVDSTEVSFGLPARSFQSFFHASEEAAISRLYGGIHYMPAITNGVEQGRKLGDFLVNKIQTRSVEEVSAKAK